jgi:FkbM family methyltransferase
VRRPVTRRYILRESGQAVTVRHRTPDLGGITEVFVHRNYDFTEPLRDAIGGGALKVVDLGANIGLFGLRFLAEHPDAEIVAYEPDPANADILRQTIDLNGLGRQWSVVEACAGVTDGTTRFAVGHYLESQVSDIGVEVPVRDVLPLLVEADVIKIDIEGAEAALFRDPRFVQIRARALWLEYHPPLETAEVLKVLEATGLEPGPIAPRIGPRANGELWAVRRRQHAS